MANGTSNGKRNQYIGVGTAILLAGGGGGIVGANTHNHPEVKENAGKLSEMHANQKVIENELNHINEKLDDTSDKVDDILEILREGVPR